MANLYADRCRLYIGGVEVLDLQASNLSFSDSAKVVQTMTTDRRNKGWVRGNREITFTLEVAVQDKLSSAKIESLDFDSQDISALYTQGADKYLLKSICFASGTQGASGVGTEAKKSFNMLALDMVDLQGNSDLFITNLKSFGE